MDFEHPNISLGIVLFIQMLLNLTLYLSSDGFQPDGFTAGVEFFNFFLR